MRSFFLSLFLAVLQAMAQDETIVVDAALHHLGQKEVATFPVPLRKPESPRLDVTFQSQPNQQEWTLRLEQRNVTDDWGIEINGSRIARLNIVGPAMNSHFAVPPTALKEGENKISIVPSNPADDIIVGKIELVPEPLRDVRKLAHLKITVVDGGQAAMPARITIANKDKVFADLYNVQPGSAGWRNGIIYTAATPVEFDLPEGEWIISATRGMEWSRASMPVTLFIGQRQTITLPLVRQVDTTGYIAADTHLHTYTYSRHGDASTDERVASLAGEGVEMAIATDHNHLTDYRPRQAALGLSPYYTSVVGNEVTSANGHFNAFPFPLDAAKPNTKETNWVRLVEDIRSKGAKFVILNHPRWPAITNSPMSIWGLNRADGSRTNEMAFTFDATEIINSTFTLKEKDFVLRDWFAILNRGERIWGVGSSDTHTVRDIPGQGRTYIPSATDDAAAINVDAVVKEMQAGNMSISYGIFGHALVDGRFKMGQLATPKDKTIVVDFHIASANWITATQAVVYLNGIKVAESNVTVRVGAPMNTTLKFKIPAPTHDAFVVCAAFGDGLKDPAWPTYANYTFAVTNPIFIDADRDGKFQSARETAVALVDKLNPITLAKLEKSIDSVDGAIGVQLLTEGKLRLPAAELPGWDKLVEKLSAKAEIFDTYKRAFVAPKPVTAPAP